MNRIIVIGSPGSGKSTLSKKLSKKLNLPIIHLDKLFWTDGWIAVSNEEFDNRLNAEMNKEKWIIDGNYSRTLPIRLEFADTVIFLDYPTVICLFRALKRIMLFHGNTRSDMGNNCPERMDFEFLKYICNFRKKQRQKILNLVLQKKNINMITIHNKSDYKRFVKEYL